MLIGLNDYDRNLYEVLQSYYRSLTNRYSLIPQKKLDRINILSNTK